MSEADDVQYRILSLPDELEEAFHLRYTVFAPMGVIPDRYLSVGTEMEVDALDRKSIPFACFQGARPQRMVAYARVITGNVQEKFRDMTDNIVAVRNDSKLNAAVNADYYSMFPLEDSAELIEFERILLENDLSRCELSRVAVDVEHQRQGLGTRLLTFLLQTLHSIDTPFDVVMLMCGLEQSPFYTGLGFHPLLKRHVRPSRIGIESRIMFRCLSDRAEYILGEYSA